MLGSQTLESTIDTLRKRTTHRASAVDARTPARPALRPHCQPVQRETPPRPAQSRSRPRSQDGNGELPVVCGVRRPRPLRLPRRRDPDPVSRLSRRACPRIARHTGVRGSGRIGRTRAGRALDPQAVRLAVIAAVRHDDTAYHQLLMSGMPRAQARDQIGADIERILTGWSLNPALTDRQTAR